MQQKNFNLHNGKSGSAITVRVTPRASRNEIVEILDDGTIKVRLTEAPVEGHANEALVKFLAKVLDVAPSLIEIVGGQTGHDKLVTIQNMTPAEVQERILKHLA